MVLSYDSKILNFYWNSFYICIKVIFKIFKYEMYLTVLILMSNLIMYKKQGLYATDTLILGEICFVTLWVIRSDK